MATRTPAYRMLACVRRHTRVRTLALSLLVILAVVSVPFLTDTRALVMAARVCVGASVCEPYDPPRVRHAYAHTPAQGWEGEDAFWAMFPCDKSEYAIVMPTGARSLEEAHAAVSTVSNTDGSHAEEATCAATIATAFFDIGRAHWHTLRRTNAEYLHHMSTVMSLRNPMVVFTAHEFVNHTVSQRAAHGFMDRTLVFGMSLHCTPAAFLYEPTRTIMCKPGYMQGAKDFMTPERLQPWYNLLMWNKAYFFRAAALLPQVRTAYYIWLDAGCHPPMCNPSMRGQCVQPAQHARPERIRIAQVDLLLPDVAEKNPVRFMKDKHVVFAGTIFGTGASNTRRLFDLFVDTLHWMNVQGAVDQDQSTFAFMFLRHADDFDTYFVNGEWLDVVERF